MREDGSDWFFSVNESDNLHGAAALADKRLSLVHPSDKLGPRSIAGLAAQRRCPHLRFFLFSSLCGHTSCLITITTIRVYAMFICVRDMLCEFRKEVQWVESLPVVFRAVENLSLIGEVREFIESYGRPNKITSQVFPCLFIFRLYSGADVAIESAVMPGEQPFDRELCHSAFVEEHREHFMAEELFCPFRVYLPREEHEVAVGEKASVCPDYVDMRVEIQKISGRMHTYHCRTDCALFLNRRQKEVPQCFIGAGAESSQEVSVIPEGPPQKFRDSESPVANGNGTEHFFFEVYGECEGTLHGTRGAEQAGLARESYDKVRPTVRAVQACESVMKTSAFKVLEERLVDYFSEEPILPLIALLVAGLEVLPVVFHYLEKRGSPWIPGVVLPFDDVPQMSSPR